MFSPQRASGKDRKIFKVILTFSQSDKKVTADLPDLQPFPCALVIVSGQHVLKREDACS
jgi:hypothetical protein